MVFVVFISSSRIGVGGFARDARPFPQKDALIAQAALPGAILSNSQKTPWADPDQDEYSGDRITRLLQRGRSVGGRRHEFDSPRRFGVSFRGASFQARKPVKIRYGRATVIGPFAESQTRS